MRPHAVITCRGSRGGNKSYKSDSASEMVNTIRGNFKSNEIENIYLVEWARLVF